MTLVRIALFLAAAAFSTSVLPQPLRICVDVHSHLPFIDQSGGGISGKLIEQAAREVGFTVSFYSRPTTRCREEIRAGIADGFPTTPFTPALIPFMAFPMDGDKADPARAVLVARAFVYRKKGSTASWDGAHFTGLSGLVLVPYGSVLLSDRLRAMQVPFDEKGKDLAASFSKLLAGRGELAIGAEFSGRAQLALPQFHGKIEALPLPFSEESYYMAVSQAFYTRHRARMDKFWEAIARIKRSSAYRTSYQAAMQQAAREQRE